MIPPRLTKFLLATLILIGVFILRPANAHFARAEPEDHWPVIQYALVTQGLNRPVHIANAGDGSDRLFIVEQAGRVRIFKGSLWAADFLDIRGRVRAPGNNNGGSEEGLLSVAFPPNFAARRYFYVYYTNRNGDNQVSRFHLTANPDIADPSSEELILYINHPTYGNHNGGQLAFGPDGKLYIATGDGGSGGDPPGNAQNPASLLGKILRIEVGIDLPPAPSTEIKLFLPAVSQGSHGSLMTGYRIPPNNPFVGVAGYRQEIWATGLRNPWRFSFDTLTGDLYIADVGQELAEEIDFQSAASAGGENYGWNIMEGDDCYNAPTCNQQGLTMPVFTYPHTEGNCSVTGGHVYRGAAQSGLQGIYFFADFCSGKLWGRRQESGNWAINPFPDTPYWFSSFGQDEDGELYFTDMFAGAIYKILAAAP